MGHFSHRILHLNGFRREKAPRFFALVQISKFMITIKKSPTADSRTCDYKNVSKEQLLASSEQHREDVRNALGFFASRICDAAKKHDHTKISGIDLFHSEFRTNFSSTVWWDAHRKTERHHLAQPDGVPDDVNLVDVLEYIADCTVAGKARSGVVRDTGIDQSVLWTAFKNTCLLLDQEVVVDSNDTWHEAHITGKEIKAHLQGEKHDVELFLIEEHEGHEQHRPAHDNTQISLKDGPKHFVTKQIEPKVYIYFVDGEKYETDCAHITGRIIKSKLPEAKYALYEEGHGKQPDQLINDDTTISFEGEKEHKRFYTVPPASFGCA